MHCNQCGLEVPDNYKFCPKCGAEIIIMNKPMGESKGKFVKNESYRAEKPKKKLSTKKAIAIGMGVFFAFVIILGQIIAYFSDNSGNENNIPSPSLEKKQENNTSKVFNMPYSWTQNNFKYTLDKISFNQYDSTANVLTDGFWEYDISITCQNLLKSSNNVDFQAITDIKLKTNVGNTWDLKSHIGLDACGYKFDPEGSRSDIVDFKIGAKEKPESLLVSTYTGEQLIFNATISK